MNKKWRDTLFFISQLLLAALIAAGAVSLLYRYARYGQQKNSERTEQLRIIRVRIKNQDFADDYHEEVRLSCEKDWTVKKSDGSCLQYPPGQSLHFAAADIPVGETVCIEGTDGAALVLESIMRGSGVPQYGGKLYLTGTDRGISVINELLLEEYLYSVVSSEMPSSYPEEAQKAQAVCARTYAQNCIRQNSGREAADLDDSVSFQVYNNQTGTKESKEAVKATEGIVLPLDEIQYYSTSGLTEKRRDLGSEASFTAFLNEVPDADAQYGSLWVRWSVSIPVAEVEKHFTKLVEAGAVQEGASVPQETEYENEGITLASLTREADGQITSAVICKNGKTYVAEGEYTFRTIFGSESAQITLRDGSFTDGMRLLPSSFCIIERLEDTFYIRGCGYGHGNGMSQCGAAEMAAKGLDYREILKYYYGVDPVGYTENADGERET